MKFIRGTAQELINWQKRKGYKFPVIAIVDNLNPLEMADVMKDGGAVNIIQRPAMDKQLVETVGRYARPGCKYSIAPFIILSDDISSKSDTRQPIRH